MCQLGIINADMKPHNTLVTPDGRLMLIDWDGAVVMDEACLRAAEVAEAQAAAKAAKAAKAEAEADLQAAVAASVFCPSHAAAAAEAARAEAAERSAWAGWTAANAAGLAADLQLDVATTEFAPTVLTDYFAAPEMQGIFGRPCVCLASNTWLFGASAAYLVLRVKEAAARRDGGSGGLSVREALLCKLVSSIARDCMVVEPWLRPAMTGVVQRLRQL